MSRFRDAALDLAERGYYVFPCRPRTKEPANGAGGFHNATRDERQILRWWDSTPDANVAVALGKSGVVVFDVDSKAGADPREVLAELDLGGAPVMQTGEAPEGCELAGVRGSIGVERQDGVELGAMAIDGVDPPEIKLHQPG